jgi:phosphate transport system permease protein
VSQAAAEPAVLFDPRRAAACRRSVVARHLRDEVFQWVCVAIACMSLLLLVVFLGAIFYQGVSTLTWTFMTAPPSPVPAEAGFFPAMMGSVWLLVLVALFALPLGVAAAIILEEFPPRRKWSKRVHAVIQTNITNLAGVPSVVYGVIGLTVFVSMFQFFGNERLPAFELGANYLDQFYSEADHVLLVPVDDPGAPETVPEHGMAASTADGQQIELNVISADADWPEDNALSARTLRDYDLPGRISERTWYYIRLPFGRGVLAGSLTLMLVILPVIIIAAQESLRAVPSSLREASMGMGATRWQTIQQVTLPAATPGIMTGAIIAMSRAIGEAAPLLMIAGIVFISNPPGNLMDDFTAMPLQIYNWAGRPQREFHAVAASGIIVLLIVLLCFNTVAVVIRQKMQKPLS